MKTYIARTWKWILTTSLLFSTACSQVSFTPGEALQGSQSVTLPDGSQRDSFLFNNQNNKSKVDILIVDDNSASMSNKQLKMQAGLQTFITSLGSIDWQIGITTTDTSTGPYGLQGSLLPLTGSSTNILSRNVPDYQTVFENSIVRSEVGSNDERPHLALMEAFAKKNTNNAGFFRDGADLAVILLTDEDEQSTGPAGSNTAQEVMNAFSATFGPNKHLTVFGIIVIPGDSACLNSAAATGSSYGNMHAQLIQATGGTMGSICETNYGPALSSIGDHVISGIQQVTLAMTPDVSTVTLDVNPADPTLTWTVTGRQVNFNKPPAQGTRIAVTYKHL